MEKQGKNSIYPKAIHFQVLGAAEDDVRPGQPEARGELARLPDRPAALRHRAGVLRGDGAHAPAQGGGSLRCVMLLRP